MSHHLVNEGPHTFGCTCNDGKHSIEPHPIQRGEEMGTKGAVCACPGECEALCMVEPQTVCRVVRDHAARQQPEPDAAVRAIVIQFVGTAEYNANIGTSSRFIQAADIARAAFAAGRALGRDEGARDERETLRKKLNDDSMQRRVDGWSQLADELWKQADAIARRGQAGGGT